MKTAGGGVWGWVVGRMLKAPLFFEHIFEHIICPSVGPILGDQDL